jgi:hypothetical protein
MESCEYYVEWNAKHVHDEGQCQCLKVKKVNNDNQWVSG